MPETRLPYTDDDVKTPFTIAAECTTDPNDLSGKSKDCDSKESVVNAPDGFVLDDREFVVSHSYNGRDPDVHLSWENHKEIIPGSGLKFPTTVKLRVHARTPKGHNGQRGWNKYQISGNMIELKKLHENVRVAFRINP